MSPNPASGNAEQDLAARAARALGPGYALGTRLGQGGFAVVYAARDLGLKRDVAVKVLRDELRESAQHRERFRREAESVARLRHPNVIPIYAVGEAEGLAFFVMPLVAGTSLRALLERERRLPVAEARRILLECAQGLAAAHKAGLVHRDVKPDNIMLDGEERRVLLTDFGIAKALETGGGAETLTQSGVVIGTPQYMSPEQATGDRTMDHRSDIYSLGVVAYQMLAGAVPFEAGTLAALLVKQVTEDPPPVTRARPECPPDLAAAIARCLAKDPARRWQRADDLVQALAGSSAAAPRVSRGAALRVPDPLRRFRMILGGAVAGVVLLSALDLLLHQVLFAPLAAVATATVVAAQYGRLWIAGYGWRDVLRFGAPAGTASHASLDSAELGPHRDAVAQARADRAAAVSRLARWPSAERARVGAVVPAFDRLIARATEVARQLYGLERQLEPGPEELARRIADTRAEPPSPGRDQRLAVLERRRRAMGEVSGRRDRVAETLSATLGAVGRLREAVEREDGGAAGSLPEAVASALSMAESGETVP